MPLDSREIHTKSGLIVWTAVLSETKEDFERFMSLFSMRIIIQNREFRLMAGTILLPLCNAHSGTVRFRATIYEIIVRQGDSQCDGLNMIF